MQIVLDTETTGLSFIKDKIIGLAHCSKNKKADYRLWDKIDKKKLQTCLDKDESIYHNAKFDLHMLKAAGFNLPKKHHDTLLMTYLIDENGGHRLEQMCDKYCGIKPWKFELQDYLKEHGFKEGEYDKVPFEIIRDYAAKDALYTMMLFEKVYPMLKEAGMEDLYNTECELSKVLVDIEEVGHRIDKKVFKRLFNKLTKEKDAIEKEIFKISGHPFNIGSDTELATVMYEELGLPIQGYSEKTKKPLTDEYALKSIDHPICKLIADYRTTSVMLSTYCKPVVENKDIDDVLRGNFNQIGTRTGRLSSNEPNMQNIPKEHDIRKGFICRKDCYNFYFDYSQMELMIYAYFSNDPYLKQAFSEGRDVHSEMGCEFFRKETITADERALVKGLNFGIIYGLGARGIMKKFKKTKQEAYDILNRYYTTFPILRKFNQHVMKKIEQEGYIQNPFGRRRRLNPDEAYKGVNALVQGTCGDIMKRAMIKVHAMLKSTKSRILLTIHDELVIEVHKTELDLVPKIKAILEDFPQFDVKLKAEIKWTKTNWKDKQDYTEEKCLKKKSKS